VSNQAHLLERGHARGVDGDQAELLAAVCEATRGGRQPAPIVTVARCSGLTGAEIARELPTAIAAGLIGRDSATRRLLPTRHGLQVARLL